MKRYFPLLSPALFILIALVAFPTVYLLFVSTQQWLLSMPNRDFVGLGNFIDLFNAPDFHSALLTTIIYVVFSTLLTATAGFVLAFLMSGTLRGRNVMRTIIVLPLIVPPVVAGFSWKFLLSREVGLVGAWFLPILGFEAAMLADPKLAMVSILIADLWSKTPLMFLIFLAGLQAIPDELYEMATMDGTRMGSLIRYIILPLLRPTIGLALVLRLIDAINVFDLIYVMTAGGPGTATQTLPLLGWKIGFNYFNFGQASALAVIMLVLVVVPSTIIIRRFTRLAT
ncbi:MAG: sugar ABC transporter permease [Chloroflexota bacterium]|jgi:multiple sugar transport system permease protein